MEGGFGYGATRSMEFDAMAEQGTLMDGLQVVYSATFSTGVSQ